MSLKRIAKLASNGSNYANWSWTIQTTLEAEDLWDCIAEAIPTDLPPDATDTQKLTRKEWDKQDRRAKSIIAMSVEDGITAQIRSFQHAKQIWDKLQTLHAAKGMSATLLAHRRLSQALPSKFSSMTEFFTELDNAANDYNSAAPEDAPVFPPVLLALHVALHLPPDYAHLTHQYFTPTASTISLDTLKMAVLDVERRLTATKTSSDSNSATAMYARSSNKRRGPPRTDAEKASYQAWLATAICHTCHQQGHVKSSCPQNRNNPTPTTAPTPPTSSKNDQAHVAAEPADWSEDDECYVATATFDSIPEVTSAFLAREPSAKKNTWIIDSGCTNHMTACRDDLIDYREYTTPTPISLGDKSTIYAKGEGSILLRVSVDGVSRTMRVNRVKYVPALGQPLLSVMSLIQQGHNVFFYAQNSRCRIFAPNSTTVLAESNNPLGHNLFLLRTAATESPDIAATAASGSPGKSFDLLHKRLGHPNSRILRSMIRKGLVEGVDRTLPIPDEFACTSCDRAKMTKIPFQTGHERATERLIRIHSDICGEFEKTSVGGNVYFATLIDDATSMIWVKPLKHKSDFADWFIKMDRMFLNNYGRHVGILRSDNGGEYVNSALHKYCDDHGIQIELTVPGTPEQNGVAERANRKLQNAMRAMMRDNNCPDFLWADAMCTAAHCLARVPTIANGGITPYEAFHGRKPDISNLRVFYCDAFVHIPKDAGAKKLGDRARAAKFIGYPDGIHGWRFWDPVERKVSISRSPKFIERAHPVQQVDFISSEDDDTDDDNPTPPARPIDSQNNPKPNPNPNIESNATDETPAPLNTRPRRTIRAPRQFEPDDYGPYGVLKRNLEHSEDTAALANEITCLLAESHIEGAIDQHSDDDIHLADSPSAKEALSSPEAPLWLQAVQDELNSIQHAGVYELVNPKNENIENIIGNKLVLRRKRGHDGKITKYKARLTAQGFRQREGIDYTESFAPVVKSASLRVFFALCAQHKLQTRHMDVKCAFLNGVLKETIFMRQPKGFEEPGKEDWVWKLKKAIYGLKQGGREWYSTIDSYFVDDLDFTRIEADHCVYILRRGDSIIIIPLYVDDLLIGYSHETDMNNLRNNLMSRFEMTDLGSANWVIGIRIQHNYERGIITLDQSQYINRVLQRFGMHDSNPERTPLPEKINLVPATDTEIYSSRDYPFLEAIGSLMYAMLGTRPDIAYAVSLLSRYASKPGPNHISALKHLFRYLRGTSKYGLVFRRDGGGLIGYTDSDYAEDTPTRRSTSGGVFLLAGSPVSWSSKLQSVVTLSSTEAEYIASTEGAKEIIWLRRLLFELGYGCPGPTPFFIDNRGAQLLAKNPIHHARTKHIDVRHHFIRHAVADRVVDLRTVGTEDNLADICTKALGKFKISRFRTLLGMEQVHSTQDVHGA